VLPPTAGSSDDPDLARILIVDDQASNLEAIEALLEHSGCLMVRAQSADEALLALLDQDFAAIVLDIKMPGMNGIDLADLIKARPRSRHVPILFLTAHMFNEREVLRGYGAGAVDYLTKPVHAEILRSKIGVFVELFRKTRDLARMNEALRSEMAERARAEEALRVANHELEARVRERTQALERADRRKDEFLAVLGHELRNPLAPIISAIEVMQPGAAETEHAQARGVVRRQVRQMARLIDDLLDVGRITSDRFVLRMAPVELCTVVAAAIETSKPLRSERRHQLSVHIPESPATLIVDAARVSQVLANVLTNAAKYTPPGGRVALHAEVNESGVTIRVRDSGVGIEPSVLPSLFELFARVDHEGGIGGGGLGIGLALARRLVEMHGGQIQAASDGRGCGAEFTIWLPPAVIAPDAAVRSSDVTHAPTTRRLRVLVVDDNDDAAEMLTTMLGQWGYDVRPASTGRMALQVADAFEPEIVLLDLGLPDLDGYAIAEQLRSNPWATSTRIFALTGRGQEEDRRRSRASGLDEHLVKPLDPDELRALLSRSAGNESFGPPSSNASTASMRGPFSSQTAKRTFCA
jgi:signal transduction histidine kinase